MSAPSHRGGCASGSARAGWAQGSELTTGLFRHWGEMGLSNAESSHGTADLGELLPADMQRAGCRLEGGMPSEELHGAWIEARVEQRGGTAVPERMHAASMRNPGALAGLVVYLACRATGPMALGVLPRE